MKTHIRMLVAGLAATLAVLAAAMLGSSSQAQAHAQRSASPPPPADTIVRVLGHAANGYAIRRYDGTWEFPPPSSEARAACADDDTRVARVRCRTEVRTWYRDLADAQQALAWARRSG